MSLDPRTCYRALRARDRRFDGRFFTGVTSTGIYCRPVCPARTPRRDRCVFFAHAAAAEEAGFRPCLRCRPETSPGTPTWQGASATVSRALRLIDEGALDRGGVDDLAARLGIGSRHLRRLFDEHVGASPLAVGLTRRVHFAKRLLDGTRLPILHVAHASGFHNARRFNAAFRGRFGRPPSAVRCAADPAAADGAMVLRLSYRPPLAWEAMLGYLGARAIPGVEQVRQGVYRRTIALDGAVGLIEVSHDARHRALVLRAPVAVAPRALELVERVRALFDLGADPATIEQQLGEDPDLVRAGAPSGMRVPGTWDRFELAVRAILGQQVTVRGATTIAGRLARALGRPFAGGGDAEGPDRIFPTPAVLAGTPVGELAALGMPAARAEAIRGLARAVAAGEPVLEPAASLEQAVARLTGLAGIGEWTAQYVAMRALREPDAFPSGDLGLRRALAPDGRPLSPRELERRAEAWRPWRAYAAVRLWVGSDAGQEQR